MNQLDQLFCKESSVNPVSKPVFFFLLKLGYVCNKSVPFILLYLTKISSNFHLQSSEIES